MLPRFCKLCYQVFDESIVKFRRFSVKTYKPSEYFSDDEYKNETPEYVDEEKPTVEPKEKKKTLLIKCKRSNLNFYLGDTYAKFQPIPLASRSWQHRNSRGDYFTIYPHKNILDHVNTSITFKDVGIDNRLIKKLEEKNIIYPTEIQKLSIPKILSGHNTVLTAETGCGKTYAFLLPLLQQILHWKHMKDRGFNRPLGLIITPSRELTIQIANEAKMLAKDLDINIVKLIGGRSKRIIDNPPVNDVDLVIATLGVMSKMITTKIYKLEEVKHVVLDEADTLFDGTFSDKLCYLLRKISFTNENSNKDYPDEAQLTLNSATVPENLPVILNHIVDVNTLVPVVTGNEHQIKVPQKFLRLGSSQKPEALLKLIKPKAKSKTPVIIFTNTSATCDFISIFLKKYNIEAVNLHGEMPVHYRRGKFQQFVGGTCHILTTTDAGARGLDTTIVKNVINYDFPSITSEYIHRCGRTGRIGSPKDCKVINFISHPIEIILTRKIEFAARKMKPIPMVDMIHNTSDEEMQFLHSNLDEERNKRDENENDMLNLDNTDTGFSLKIPN